NLLSMGAIDFGILLDGAVILVENAYRHLAEEQPPPEEVPHVVARAAKEVVRPTLFSLSIIVAAMMPIFTLERVEGRIFRPVALTYAFSLDHGAAVLRATRLALLEFPEVADVLTEQGHPEDGTDDEAPNQAETFVIMKPQRDWHTGRTKDQVVDAMRAKLEKRPGVDYN